MFPSLAPKCFTCMLFVIVIAVLTLVGCNNSSSSSSANLSPDKIEINSDHDWDTVDEVYDWNTSGSVARVEFRVRGFHHGSIKLTIRDAAGDSIYEKHYHENDNSYIIGADEYLDIDFTNSGAPGLWTIDLEFTRFSGHLYLTLDNTNNSLVEEVSLATSSSILLDSSFGASGLASYVPFHSYGYDLVVDNLGRSIVSGTLLESDGTRNLCVWRFLPSGILDHSFGTNGTHIFDFFEHSQGRAIALDSNNRILVTGWAKNSSHDSNLILIRLLSAGTLDPNFSMNGGFSLVDLAGNEEVGVGIRTDGNNLILVSGNSSLSDNSNSKSILVRFLENGEIDTSFGSAGVVETVGGIDHCFALAIDSSNSSLMVGKRGNSLAIWKFDESGLADLSFGLAGVTIDQSMAIGEVKVGLDIEISSLNSSISVCGLHAIENGAAAAAFWRFEPDGQPTNSFGINGFNSFILPNGTAISTSLSIDSNNGFIAVGTARSLGSETDDASACAWKIDTNGNFAAGFGASGFERFDVRTTANTITAAAGVSSDPSGRLLVTGAAVNLETGAADLSVWRINP